MVCAIIDDMVQYLHINTCSCSVLDIHSYLQLFVHCDVYNMLLNHDRFNFISCIKQYACSNYKPVAVHKNTVNYSGFDLFSKAVAH